MELIDKSTIVEEIEKRISLFKKEQKPEKWSAGGLQMNVVILGARIAMLEEILSFLNTLEVKEVNLKKVLSDLDKDIKEFVTTEEFEKDSAIYGHYWAIAKHFFELGIKSKGE